VHEKRFKHTESHKLEDPERLIWLPPGEVIAHLGLRPGIRVVDIGAGTGYFAIPIAREILPGGRVTALDVEAEMLAKLKAKLDLPDAPGNIDLVQGEAENTTLESGCYDVVLLAQIWHEIDDRKAALAEARRILGRDGRIAILDWRPDADRPPGPKIEHRIPAEAARAELTESGWLVDHQSNIGQYSYLIVAH